MKRKNYAVHLIILLLITLIIPFSLTATAQYNSIISVDAEQNMSDRVVVNQTRPVRINTGDALSQQESHNLAPLTQEEINMILATTEPPAIGMVRNLTSPVSFSLDDATMLPTGSMTYAGGRLTRLNGDTLVWTSSFKSAGAKEIRLFLSEGNFPAGVSVNLYGDRDYSFQQVELQGTIGPEGFYTTTVFSQQVTVQMVIPVSTLSENFHFTIPGLVHVYDRPVQEAPNVDCFEDVNCAYANGYANIGILKGSAAQLTFVVGALYYICSGNLLNDTRSIDYQPFLLTANHCFSTQASAVSLEAKFDYFTTSCNGSINPSYLLVTGSNLIATNSQTDFTLVLLHNNPAGRWYLGWNLGAVANDETLHSVNHPSGTPQKYYRALNKTSPDFTCGGLPTSNFHYTRAIGGETVGGSSGGNITLAGSQVVGQLYGWCYLTGATECNYPTYYNVWGKFDVSYNNNNLQFWLNNGGSTASIYVPVSTLNFGSGNLAGYYYYQTVTVYNNGSAPNYLNLEASASITGTDASQFSIIGPTFLYLDPNTSATFTIRFNPTSSGVKNATLNIGHNAQNAINPVTVALTGSVEPCSDIISLNQGGSANARTYSKSGTGVWYTSWNTPCGYQCPGNEQIYSFVAPYTGFYSIEVTSSNYYYIDYMWKEAVCDGGVWNCIDDIAYPGTYGSVYWTAGTTYYILADAETTSLATQTFYIFYNPCQNITPITGTGIANTVTYDGGGYGAWNTSSAGTCGYLCPGIEHIYSFVAPYTGYYSLTVTSASQYYVDYMWSTSCGSTGWTCIDDIYTPGTYGSMFWQAGQQYYILLDDEDNVAASHSFYLNLPEPCNNVIPITCGSSQIFNAIGTGVWDFDPCWSSPGFEQIYSFVAPYTGQYSIRVTSTDNTWVDYVWKEGSCSADDWNCINYIIYPGQYGSMSWTAGQTYYIRLDDEDIYYSSHTFSIVCPTVCQDCGTYDFLVTPQLDWQNHSSSVPAYGCKMYRFEGWAGYPITFKTGCGDGATADFDTYLEIYDETCTLLASNNDGCGLQSEVSFNPPYGYAIYYLKVSGNMGAAGNYTLAYNYCYYAPSQPTTIYGPATAVQYYPTSYSIDPVPYATSYTWSYSGSGTISGTGTSIMLTAETAGVLSVTANNACGSSLVTSRDIYVVPNWLWITSGTLVPGYHCFDAAATIEVAGAGYPVIVPNGSSMELVAGQNILIHPGFTVLPGGYLLARIDDDGNFCNAAPTKESGLTLNGLTISESQPTQVNKDQFFKVYPNPTTGAFTLELSEEPGGNKVRVQCYNLMGALIMDKTVDAGRTHRLTLENQAPGMYVIKVIQNGATGMEKIIRQ